MTRFWASTSSLQKKLQVQSPLMSPEEITPSCLTLWWRILTKRRLVDDTFLFYYLLYCFHFIWKGISWFKGITLISRNLGERNLCDWALQNNLHISFCTATETFFFYLTSYCMKYRRKTSAGIIMHSQNSLFCFFNQSKNHCTDQVSTEQPAFQPLKVCLKWKKDTQAQYKKRGEGEKREHLEKKRQAECWKCLTL